LNMIEREQSWLNSVNLPPHYQNGVAAGLLSRARPIACRRISTTHVVRPDLFPRPGLLEPFADCEVGVAGSMLTVEISPCPKSLRN
jgi:hypothetical protein